MNNSMLSRSSRGSRLEMNSGQSSVKDKLSFTTINERKSDESEHENIKLFYISSFLNLFVLKIP